MPDLISNLPEPAQTHASEGETMTHYIVQTALAKMPNSCWGTYRRVAVLEVDAVCQSVSMISDHARGCRRVVRTWERCNVGTTDRCAYAQALAAAYELAAELNAKIEVAS